jgi:hypothetical protein
MVCLLRRWLRHLAQPLLITGGLPIKLFRIQIFCQNAQVFHRSIPNKIFRIQIFCQNATQVFHRAGLKILISLTKAMLARMAVLLTGGGTACSPPPGGHVHFSLSDIDTSNDMVLGGKITTPRFTDRFRSAHAKNTSKFDSAGLAEAKYHIGNMGVDLLTPQIISNCGYQSFHWGHPEDILLCNSKIANIRCVVLQGWTNYWTHFIDPVVEYILKKALPVFPRLNSLAVADVVKFYDSVQKILMRYLLPLMPFNLICLAFGFEGLCPPGMGTIRYAAIALAWMDVLPCILPKDDSEVESVKFLVGYESNNGFDLMWQVMELAVPGFKSTNPVQVPL